MYVWSSKLKSGHICLHSLVPNLGKYKFNIMSINQICENATLNKVAYDNIVLYKDENFHASD